MKAISETAGRHNISLKKFLTSLLIIAISSVLSVTDARKTFLVKKEHPAVLAPKVQAYDSSWKILNIGNYKIALDNQIQVDVGFDFI